MRAPYIWSFLCCRVKDCQTWTDWCGSAQKRSFLGFQRATWCWWHKIHNNHKSTFLTWIFCWNLWMRRASGTMSNVSHSHIDDIAFWSDSYRMTLMTASSSQKIVKKQTQKHLKQNLTEGKMCANHFVGNKLQYKLLKCSPCRQIKYCCHNCLEGSLEKGHKNQCQKSTT